MPLFLHKTAPRSRRRRNFQLESLEQRNLLSVPTGPPAVLCHTHSVSFAGTGSGTAYLGAPSQDNSGNVLVPVTSNGTAVISHLGKISLYETHTTTILASTNFTTSTVNDGEATFTAANGDLLFATFTGSGVLIAPNRFHDTFTFKLTGGTGRFHNASGGGTIISTDSQGSPPQIPFAFSISGTLSLHHA